jgi:hypothetical protein
MHAIIRYTIITALRDWLFLGILLLVLLGTTISLFLGSTALVEQQFMAAAFISSAVRMITILGLVVFVCFHVRRSFDNKEVELILSKPISRVAFVISYFSGFAWLAFCIVTPVSLLFWALHLIKYLDLQLGGLIWWSVSFYLETLIVLSFTFFGALLLRSAVSSVLFALSFYFLCRIYGFLLISINSVASMGRSTLLGRVSEDILSFLGIFIPRLDMFTKSEWLIYGFTLEFNHIYLVVQSTAIYVMLFLAMAVFDFVRKQF